VAVLALMVRIGKTNAVAGWVALGAFVFADPARAQLATCDDAANVISGDAGADAGPGTSAILVVGPTASQGSDGAQTTVQALAGMLGLSSRVYYVPWPSCTGLQSIVEAIPAPTAAMLLSTAGASNSQSCLVAGVPDVAVSDVYADTCTSGLLTAGQADLLGPVQTTTFVVPSGSSQKVISADAAYVVFGFGAGSVGPYTVSPWTDPTAIVVPNRSWGPIALAGAGIGLVPNNWVGAKQSAILTVSSEASGVAGKSSTGIGLLPAQAVVTGSGVKKLAYQHTAQQCGYLPDSDADHFDKINVRDGRYALWGPLHFVFNVDGGGHPVDHTGHRNPALDAFVGLVVATGPYPQTQASVEAGVTLASDAGAGLNASQLQTVLEQEAAGGLVPWCAMHVMRGKEVDAEGSYQPPQPCNCAFEAATGATVSPCFRCQSDSDCGIPAAPTCRFGYCEAQ